MPVHVVNLDALIRREDFEIQNANNETSSLAGAETLKIIELERDSLMFKWLRKPDFQRTTAYWTPKKVAGFIYSFLNGDLIPALILWQSETSGSIFVIDGAHRLSALVGWVHDDYGDKGISTPFFDGRILEEQREAAEETRDIISKTIGSYVEIKHGNLTPERARFASKVAAGGVTLQWVRGDATQAYRSFHTINTEQTPIGELERRYIRDRRGPNAMAAKALVSAGTGQFGRSSFSEVNKAEVRKIAKGIYEDLFIPPLHTPIKTLDLPVAGRSYSGDSMGMILDFVEFVNRTEINTSADPNKPKKRQKRDILAPTMSEDADGSMTIQFLRNARKASSLIAGVQSESLGLHPAVYFYSATGNYQPAAFLAAVNFVQDIQAKDQLSVFTKHRKDFEELLLKYKHFINEIVRKYGGGLRSLTALVKLYEHLFDAVVNNKSEAQIVPILAEDDRLAFLKPIIDSGKGEKKEFDSERKSAVYLREALSQAVRCKICGARVHLKSITIDHIQRKEDGGAANVDNGQVSHPYCNSGYKESMTAQEKKLKGNV